MDFTATLRAIVPGALFSCFAASFQRDTGHKFALPTLSSVNSKDPQFIELFSNHPSRMTMWKAFLQKNEVSIMAEIGVWKGGFAAEILRDCGSISQYHMVDPWANLPDWNKPFNVNTEAFELAYREAMDVTEFAREKRIVHRGKTKDVINAIPQEALDFAYIDGDHTLRGITIDLFSVFPKVKPGGFIGGDDFVNNPWQHDTRFEPTLVCPYAVYFAEAIGVPIFILPHNQFLICKDSAEGFSFTDLTKSYDLALNNKLPPKEDPGLLGRIGQWIARK